MNEVCEFFKASDFEVPNGFGPQTASRAAEIANMVLSGRSVRVYSGWHSHERGHSQTDTWSTDYWPTDKATYQALLIGIKPIAKEDTAEQLVKDLAGHAKFQYGDGKWAMNAEYWVDRARKLLSQKPYKPGPDPSEADEIWGKCRG